MCRKTNLITLFGTENKVIRSKNRRGSGATKVVLLKNKVKNKGIIQLITQTRFLPLRFSYIAQFLPVSSADDTNVMQTC